MLAASAYVAGRLLTRRLPLAPGIERAAVAATVGLAALAHLALALGLAGRLTRPYSIAALAAVHLLAWRSWRDLAADLRAMASGPPPDLPPVPTAALPGGRNAFGGRWRSL